MARSDNVAVVAEAYTVSAFCFCLLLFRTFGLWHPVQYCFRL